MMSEKYSFGEWIVGSLMGVALIASAAFFEGFVLSIMWKWFLVPLEIPAIGIAHAVGISTMVGMSTHQTFRGERGDDAWKKTVSAAFVVPLMALVIGVVVLQFM